MGILVYIVCIVLAEKKWRMPCFKKCFRFWKMEYNCRKLWSSAIQFQASLSLPMRQKSDSEIPLRLWLHLRFLVQELAIHLHSTIHDTLSVQFPLFCLPVYQSKVYLITICKFSIRVHSPLFVCPGREKCIFFNGRKVQNTVLSDGEKSKSSTE